MEIKPEVDMQKSSDTQHQNQEQLEELQHQHQKQQQQQQQSQHGPLGSPKITSTNKMNVY